MIKTLSSTSSKSNYSKTLSSTNKRIKRMKKLQSSSSSLFNNKKYKYLTILLLQTIQFIHFIPSTNATITLIGTDGKYYETIEERRFGTLLSYGIEYVARMQYLGNVNDDNNWMMYDYNTPITTTDDDDDDDDDDSLMDGENLKNDTFNMFSLPSTTSTTATTTTSSSSSSSLTEYGRRLGDYNDEYEVEDDLDGLLCDKNNIGKYSERLKEPDDGLPGEI